jgi:hypothetical protein
MKKKNTENDASGNALKTVKMNFTCTITNWELQNFEQIDDYNTSASPFFNWTGGFGRLVPQLSAYNISFLKGCCGILSDRSRMGRSQKQGVAKLSSRCVT